MQLGNWLVPQSSADRKLKNYQSKAKKFILIMTMRLRNMSLLTPLVRKSATSLNQLLKNLRLISKRKTVNMKSKLNL